MNLNDLQKLVRAEKRKKARAKWMPMSLLVTGVVSAAGAAAAAGMLFAPQSGQETRKWLKRKAFATTEHIKHHACKKSAAEVIAANDPVDTTFGEGNLK